MFADRPVVWTSRKENSMNTTNTVESYRPELLGLLGRLDANRAQLRWETSHHMDDEPARALSEPPLEPADLSAARQEEEIVLGMLKTEDHLYAEVNAALARLEDHSFGDCESCGHPIPRTRLRAVPYARHCIACALASEEKAS
jgi:RNA polymerase-binding transcription factor